MTDNRATAWSVTINMKSVSQTTADECINAARSRGWSVEGQLEQGEEGTKHYQLLVRTPQTRFSAIKKAFPTAHIEAARNVAALKEYVHKTDTRVGQLKPQSDLYPSITKMWELIWGEWLDKEHFVDDRATARTYAQCYIPIGDKARLAYLDQAGADLIRQGYHVEHHIVNPQVRSSFTKFAHELAERTIMKMNADRQTDRQTEFAADTIYIPTTDDSSQSEEHAEEHSEADSEEDYEQEVSGESSDEDTEGSSGSDSEGSSGDEVL